MSTPQRLVEGINAGVAKAGSDYRSAGLFLHGSTIAINTILERKGAKTALLITHDLLEAVTLSDRVLVMSRRPGRIVEDVRIPFARPRDLAIGETVAFNEICGHLRGKIEHMRR